MPPIIGIDLGSTNSLVSFWDGNKAIIIPNALGELLTPSAVSLDEKTGDILVGAAAKDRLITHPHLSAALFKRYMGSNREYRLGSHVLRPEDLSSLVLRALKSDAEVYLGEAIEEAVISVPAYFSEQQRRMTQTAGTLAGLKVERLINEPTAAAICYGLHQSDSRLLVFDLGGGTFDVSVLEVFDGIIEVNATAGHNALGGEDFVDLMVADFLAQHQLSHDALDPKTHGLLRWHAEQLKRDLSRAEAGEALLRIAGRDYQWQLDRERLQQLALPLLQRMRQPVERALNDARISPRQLDSVVLVGGATRMPLVRALCARMLGKFPICQHDPDLVVAMGTAIQAGLKARDQALDDVVLTDVCPYSLGLDTAHVDGRGVQQGGYFSPIIERNTVVPVSRAQRYTTCVDGQSAVCLRVYQGENRRVENNIFLGELSLEVPPGPAGSQAVDVRFTYDINGLLEVQAEVVGTGQTRSVVIQYQNQHMSPAQIAQRLLALQHLKIHPRDQAENRQLLARGERLFEQSLGEVRQVIAEALRRFDEEINRQDLKCIRAARKQLREQLNQIELARV